ncbi:MAG: polysaccharide deacetylase family protein [Pyrinomonadaceae bacterium]|nr:polysaccharide deacetylase family protein [Pyrinomonadaceae bacterium]
MKLKIFSFVVLLVFPFALQAQKTPRFVAVTIDDLPVVSTRRDLKNRQEITNKLLAHIRKAKVPAIGFVNENKLYANNRRDEAQVDLLRSWLNANLELGNHTFSHLSLHDNSLEKYEADILQGEIITKELLRAKNLKMRYFRHPYLWTGLDLETKAKLGVFLTEHDYTIAPVTIDNSDWIFSGAYDKAFDRNDKKLMREIGAAYVPYLEAKMDYWERQSIKLFNREIKQTLLLHANFINSDYFDDIAAALKKRGYQFVTLDEALKDEAYKTPDTFVKRNGISWLHRWALAKGRETVLPGEPKTPDFVLKAAGVESE